MFSVAKVNGKNYLAKYKDKSYILSHLQNVGIYLTCTLDGGFFPPQQIVTINGVTYSSGRGGVTFYLTGNKGTSETLTVTYNGETLYVPVTYTQGATYTAAFSTVVSGSTKYTTDETVKFIVPSNITKIKCVGSPHVADAPAGEDVSYVISVANASSGLTWGKGWSYSENDYDGENDRQELESVVAVTAGKTYALRIYASGANGGITLSWGKDINALSATVSDL